MVLMQQGGIVDLDATLAMSAARLSLEMKLPMADSIILATARANNATLWTQDDDFEGIGDVKYIARKKTAMNESSVRSEIFVATKPIMKKLRQERHRKRMNNAGQKIVVAGICRPDGAWVVGGVLATKMPLLTELGDGINDIRLFYENDVRFLNQMFNGRKEIYNNSLDNYAQSDSAIK